MVVGFNHNFSYKGVVYHIQTEDGGLNRPNIVTLLYHGGTILGSRKTSYADITKVSHLAKVVEDLMKEQHKGMLRSLRAGEFDDAIARLKVGQKQNPPLARTSLPPADEPLVAAPRTDAYAPGSTAVATGAEQTQKQAAPPSAGTLPPNRSEAGIEASLDEIVLSYLMGDEK